MRRLLCEAKLRYFGYFGKRDEQLPIMFGVSTVELFDARLSLYRLATCDASRPLNQEDTTRNAAREFKLYWLLLVAVYAGWTNGSCAFVAQSQGSRPGPVTGVIDGVAFEGNQYYVHGWACQEGQRGSIDVHLYAGGLAGGQPPGA